MANSSFSSLLSAAPLPDPPQVDARKNLYQYQLERDRYDRAMHDYIRRLMQAISGPNIVNELILTQQITNILNNVLTTKGDLMTHTGSATVRQGVGTNGQVLTADSGVTNGIKWATPSSSFATGIIDYSTGDALTQAAPANTDYDHSFTLTVPSSAWNTAGSVLHFHAGGEMSVTAGTSPELWRPDLKLLMDPAGTPVPLLAGAAMEIDAVNNLIWVADWYLMVATAGASGAVRGDVFKSMSEIYPTTTRKNYTTQYELMTIDTTVSHDFTIRIQPSQNAGTGTQVTHTVREMWVRQL